MLPRTRSRKRALDILHSADVTGRPLLEVLASEEEPVGSFTATLVQGVAAHADEIDGVIRSHADRWTIERMPVVDRNLLRIALFEILLSDETPPGAAINEAVELAKMFSTEDSGRFVNGLLGKVARERGIG